VLGGLWVDCRLLDCHVRIYQDVKNTDMKYKNRVRSRISNLKDSKNPELKKNVLCGAITPEQIAVMTSEVRKPEEQGLLLTGGCVPWFSLKQGAGLLPGLQSVQLPLPERVGSEPTAGFAMWRAVCWAFGSSRGPRYEPETRNGRLSVLIPIC